MTIPVFFVDAFATKPFEGNPAGVCLLAEARPAGWMQSLAAELNLSETAFVRPLEPEVGLRFFSPRTEIPLCGHATLAAAHVLWERQLRPLNSSLTFRCPGGVVSASRRDGLVWLAMPQEPMEPSEPPPGLFEALGVSARCLGKTRRRYVLEVDREQTVRDLRPDFGRLLACCPDRGVVVTSPAADLRFDFVSRYFVPAFGVNEDPVCGAAHCCLGPYWGSRLSKRELVALQVSARGGVVRVRVDADRVHLGGSAVTVICGELTAE